MNLVTSVLGSTTCRLLQESRQAAVLIVGKDRFTRGQLAHVECFNYHACRLLTHVFQELKVPSLQYVYDKLPPQALAVPRMGVVSLAVLGAAFEAKGIGHLEAYARKHTPNGNGKPAHLITFDTIKRRELERERAAEKRTRKRRRAQLATAADA